MILSIESERLILRKFVREDLPALTKIADQQHIAYWLPDWKNSAVWINDWFAGIREGYAINNPTEKFILLAITLKETNQVIGQINIGHEYDEYQQGEMGVGYFISEEYLNKGYATEAVKSLSNYAFATWGYDHLAAVVKPQNQASRRVLVKSGFQYVSELAVKMEDKMMVRQYYHMYPAYTAK